LFCVPVNSVLVARKLDRNMAKLSRAQMPPMQIQTEHKPRRVVAFVLTLRHRC
jgi:hypothetical protein